MQNLREAKVYHFDVSLFVYHHVFRLDVSVYDVISLECFQCTDYLTCIKLNPAFLAIFAQLHIHLILNNPIQILAWKILKDKINIFMIRKSLL